MAVDIEQELREFQREYTDFLDDDNDDGIYHEKVAQMIHENGRRLIINVNDLRKKNLKRATNLLKESQSEILACQRALMEYVMTVDATYGKQYNEFFVGFEGSFGAKHVTPRSLSSRHLGNLVCLEGIVTKCSLINIKVVKSVHFCPATGKTIERRYTDLTSLDPFPSSAVYPTKDDEGNPLETEYGLSVYRDHQTISIQEMPEKAPAGQLPRSVEVILDDDLVDSCKPGDRVQVVGTYRCLPSKKQNYSSCVFKTILIANNVISLSDEVVPDFSPRDVNKIRRFCRNSRYDAFELLAQSLAPSIHGHDYIKKAILCLLLGGVEKILANGTRLRGDINILLMGDPSTAKSQLLRYVLHAAPRAITTTGRGSSGVGLTAAVTTDQETNERRLEAGAMVLADRGVVCIDEFDKMSDMDRTAIHEVMEQGRVTVAKAGIHAKLNARCSVLAAANPVYGRYDEYKTPMDNIGMQDSLLSRFDCIFIVLDEMDPDHDRRVAEHVLRMHRYRNPGEQDGEVLPLGTTLDTLATGVANDNKENEELTVFDKHDDLLHGQSRSKKFISMEFMRKYLHVARQIKPKLTHDACDLISLEYTKLRAQENVNSDKAKTQPVTARTLETLIRLSTAHAKARMSKTVDKVDAESAIDLVNFAYFKKVMQKPKKKKSKDDEEDGETKKGKKRGHKASSGDDPPAKRPPRKKQGDLGYDPYEFGSGDDDDGDDHDVDDDDGRDGGEEVEGDEEMETETTPQESGADRVTAMEPQRMAQFRSLVQKAFEKEYSQSLPLDHIVRHVNEGPSQSFSRAEIDYALDKMQDANQVMVSEGVVFLI